MNIAQLERWLRELDERNADNVARTESYLELYAYTRAHPPDLPWLLMAHLVSRNAGYLMTDVSRTIERPNRILSQQALANVFLFLERANFLIFYDAWHHILHHLLHRTSALEPRRTPVFVRRAWRRYEASAVIDPVVERTLVYDLVTNEQNYIERRVVHSPRFRPARAIVDFAESIERDEPLVMPLSDARIRVERFADLSRRIRTGERIFDEVLADRQRRDAIFAWARANAHSGSRDVYGGKAGPSLRDAWPMARVRALSADIHTPAEPDPDWP